MGKTLPLKQLALLVGDIVAVAVSFYLVPALHFGIFLNVSFIFDWPDLSAMMIYLFLYYIFDLYNLEEKTNSTAYAMRFLAAVITADLLIVALFYVFNVRPYSKTILFLNSFLLLSFCLGWHFLYAYLWNQSKKVLRTLIIGAGNAGGELSKMLSRRADFSIFGFLDDDPGKWGTSVGLAPVLGGTDQLMTLLEKIDVVIVAITHDMSRDLYKKIVAAKMLGITVYEMPSFYERIWGKIPVCHVSDLWFVYMPLSGVQRNLYNLKIKRIVDLIFSSIGLLITLPITLLLALFIKCESDGPVFYIHKRIGYNGHPFDLVKFRTMKTGQENNRVYAGQRNDPRITIIGRILRRSRLDEIPQMWNVIKGDMSLIGPRALIQEEVNDFSPQIPYFSLRHSMRPGITGWAQINYPHGATLQDALNKLEYDLYYIKNVSPLLDLIILVRTVRTVLCGSGAR